MISDQYINSLIGEGTLFKGDLEIKGLLRIDGDFQGSVKSSGRVLVGPTGRARCAIHAKDVVVGGVVKGDIYAEGKVILLASGLVLGNIFSPQLTVEDGALWEGYGFVTLRIRDEGIQPIQTQNTYTLKLKNRPATADQPRI